ncbi:MAG TPA: site-specific DNA-methyltransferase [Ignavibacteriaceae bacterium]|nr:site-specific DNA-methyltransferase [Ignavibacteriaceae bacterium]
MEYKNKIFCNDCTETLKEIPSSSIDLIITSPPYAQRRRSIYGGIKPDDYVQWFLPISKELFRVLKPEGTFILNIKESVVNGERHTYVIELILEMKKQGWLWTEEYIWHKKNSYPGKWPNRFRDAWERILQFNKRKKFVMYQDEVKVEIGKWAKYRLDNLSETDKKRDESRVGSGFGKNVSNWVGRPTVYPTNVINIATETANQNHSAVFPLALPEWFIRLFTKEMDIVLDPFIGSGTVAVAAIKLNRQYAGIEKNSEFCELARNRIDKARKDLENNN